MFFKTNLIFWEDDNMKKNMILLVLGLSLVFACANRKAMIQEQDEVDTVVATKFELIFVKTPHDTFAVMQCDSFQVIPIYTDYGRTDSYLCYDKDGKFIGDQIVPRSSVVFINSKAVNYPDPSVLKQSEVK